MALYSIAFGSLWLLSTLWTVFDLFHLFKDKSDILRMSGREVRACDEEWFDNIAAVIFNIKDVSNEEEEVIKALNDKYDALRDQLLLEALKKQMSDAEWAVLSEQERQARLTKLKLMERRLRKEGKFDEAAALLGDALKNSDLLEVDIYYLTNIHNAYWQ